MFLLIICAAQTVIFTIQLLNFHMLLASYVPGRQLMKKTLL